MLRFVDLLVAKNSRSLESHWHKEMILNAKQRALVFIYFLTSNSIDTPNRCISYYISLKCATCRRFLMSWYLLALFAWHRFPSLISLWMCTLISLRIASMILSPIYWQRIATKGRTWKDEEEKKTIAMCRHNYVLQKHFTHSRKWSTK